MVLMSVTFNGMFHFVLQSLLNDVLRFLVSFFGLTFVIYVLWLFDSCIYVLRLFDSCIYVLRLFDSCIHVLWYFCRLILVYM